MVKFDLASFIITFNRPLMLLKTIRQLCLQNVCPSVILVVNNGIIVDLEDLDVPSGVKVKQHLIGSNIGPAGAAHWALQTLAAAGFQWIQWIDDDDPPRLQNLNERLFDHLKILNDESVGIIAPVGSFFDFNKGVTVRVQDYQLKRSGYLSVHTVAGNQCMLINKGVIDRNCLPNPALFFGFEETNFCLKVLNAGYKIIVPCELFAESRTLSKRWNLTSRDIRESEVSAWRSYYSIRNLVYMFLYEFKSRKAVFWTLLRVIPRAFYFLFSKGRRRGFQEIYFTFLAIGHGFSKRLGMTVQPEAKLGSD